MEMKKYACKQSQEFYQDIGKFLPGGVHYNFLTSNADMPLYFKKASKSRMWDLDGNEYLDLSMKFGTALLGHNPTCVNEVLMKIDNQPPENSTLVLEVCQLLSYFIPWADRFRFGLSGTEMVYNAICLARTYTGKKKILRFNGCYHGTAPGIWGNRNEVTKESLVKNNVVLIPWNDFNAIKEEVLKSKDEIAAIITEPICVNGGSIMPAPGYLEIIRKLCDENNIVLIFDEIITGMRKGMGVRADYQVIPDLSIWGKCITNGFIPTSVLAGKKEIMDLYTQNKVVHGGTYNGYTLGLAVIKVVLKHFLEEYPHKIEKMEQQMSNLHAIFKQAAQTVGIPLVIQGPMSYSSFHVCNKIINNYEVLTKNLLMKNSILRSCMQKHGILVSPFSRLYTNLELKEQDLEFFYSRIQEAVKDAAAIYKYSKIKLDSDNNDNLY